MPNLIRKLLRVIFVVLISSAFAQEKETPTSEPMPKVSLPPAKYLYPSLVCGKPLPQLSDDTMTQLKTFYSDCYTNNCNIENAETDEFVFGIGEILFKEPREFVKKYEDKTRGYIILCSLFGRHGELEYVYCTYKMRAHINYQEGDQCQDAEEKISTPIFGSNKAGFSIEMREMPAANVPSLREKYKDQQDFLEKTDVHEFVFYGRGKFANLIQGPEKVRMLMQNLNCESLTASATETLEETKTLTHQAPTTPSFQISTTETQEISSSLSNTPQKSVSRSISLSKSVINSNWLASSEIYNDTTSQFGRYQINNGTVIDTLTGFVWEQACSNATYNWTYANSAYCQKQSTGGFSDWRLPTNSELQSLVDYIIDWLGPIAGINNMAFLNTPRSYFWSSTPMAGSIDTNEAWYVSYGRDDSLTGGSCYPYSCYSGLIFSKKWSSYIMVPAMGYIRCLRDLVPKPMLNRYEIIDNVIVKDKQTGLMWEKHASSNNMPWSNAIIYCKGESTGNYTDWRLPTVKELSTLLDYKVVPKNLIMNNTVFANEPIYQYWSSTPIACSGCTFAWGIDFSVGVVGYYGFGNNHRARCVRTPY